MLGEINIRKLRTVPEKQSLDLQHEPPMAIRFYNIILVCLGKTGPLIWSLALSMHAVSGSLVALHSRLPCHQKHGYSKEQRKLTLRLVKWILQPSIVAAWQIELRKVRSTCGSFILVDKIRENLILLSSLQSRGDADWEDIASKSRTRAVASTRDSGLLVSRNTVQYLKAFHFRHKPLIVM
jgi:hypothetical protein